MENQLDLFEGRKARDGGIRKASESAEAAHPNWNNMAYDLLKRFLIEHPGPFKAEEVRSYAAMEDFPLPPSPRAWGGIMVRAKIAGLIKREGYAQVSNVRAHAATVTLWKVNKAS